MTSDQTSANRPTRPYGEITDPHEHARQQPEPPYNRSNIPPHPHDLGNRFYSWTPGPGWAFERLSWMKGHQQEERA